MRNLKTILEELDVGYTMAFAAGVVAQRSGPWGRVEESAVGFQFGGGCECEDIISWLSLVGRHIIYCYIFFGHLLDAWYRD